ncbi:hypothetical protein D3C80_1062830 [compost metagenome]
MPHLPRAFARRRELIGRQRITHRVGVCTYLDEAIIAADLLVAHVKGMPAGLGRKQAEQRMVVIVTGNLAPVLAGIEVAGIDPQGPVPQRLGVLEAVEALLVDILQLRLPHTDAGTVVVEGIVGANVVEAVTGKARQPRRVDRVVDQRVHLLAVGRVAQAGGAELAGAQGQPGELARLQHRALVCRRQQAQIAEQQHRQVGHQLAHLQLGLRHLELDRRTQAAVFVRRLAAVQAGQQPGPGMFRAAVELETQQAGNIHTHAKGALGITGAGIEDKPLRPFLGARLGAGALDIGIVAAEEVIARLQRGAGTFDETGLFCRGLCTQSGGNTTAGQACRRRKTRRSETLHRATPGFGQQQPGAAALHGHRRAGCIERGRQAGPRPACPAVA